MYVITIPQRHGRTDGETDRQTDRQPAVEIGEIGFKRCRLKRITTKSKPQ